MTDELDSNAERRAFLAGLSTRAKGLSWSPWGATAQALMDSWQGARNVDVPAEEAVVADALLARGAAPRLLLRSAEPFNVGGAPFPEQVTGGAFIKRADAVLEEWILAVGAASGAATVSIQRGGATADGVWVHQVDAVGNRSLHAGASGALTGLVQATPWGTALAVDRDGFLVEWESRGADLLRREHWGPAFVGMSVSGFLCRSGQLGAAYFFGAGRVMKILSRGYYDGRALGANRNLFGAGRIFSADLIDGHGQWVELEAGAAVEPSRGIETAVLSAAVDDATGALCVERRGGWLRIVDDGAAVHAAALPEEAIPAKYTLRARVQRAHGTHEHVHSATLAGGALLYLTTYQDGTAFLWRR